jgi:hypothetical protein
LIGILLVKIGSIVKKLFFGFVYEKFPDAPVERNLEHFDVPMFSTCHAELIGLLL